MYRRIEIIALVLIVAVLFLTCIFTIALSDNKGPEITYDKSRDVVYSQNDDTDKLLEDVKAVDKRDGDVSDSLIVAGKVINGDGTAKITYAAKDKHNNVSKVTRIVKYIGAEDSLGENNGESVMNTEESSSESNSADTSTESKESQPETTSQHITGNNSSSDPTADIDEAAANATGIPVIKITQKDVTITEGQKFGESEALGYVKRTYDNSGDVSRRIRIDGTASSYKPGDYQIVYKVSDIDGNLSEPVTLTLHVKAKPTDNQNQSTSESQTSPQETQTQTPQNANQAQQQAPQSANQPQETPQNSSQPLDNTANPQSQ